jgi:hypothetical protein
MSKLNRYLLPRVVLCTGMALAVVAGSEIASANDLSYCRHRYGPSLADTVRGVNGTPCGIECTARHDARWAKIRHCVAMRAQARHHG